MCAMRWPRNFARASAVFVLVAAAVCAVHAARSQAGATSLVGKLHTSRTSPGDLEVGGDLAGVAPGETRFLAREDLLAVSRPMSIKPGDGNYTVPAHVKAVPLEDLTGALGVPAGDMVIAICKDKYRAHYSRTYLAAHHPALVVELNGRALSDWPKDNEGNDPGPYEIAYENFKPTFKILAASDEPQVPWGIVRLEFRDEKSVFGAIAPLGAHANDETVQDGYKIAEQNCFRCHNSGAEGGLKSGVAWTVLAALAANSPVFFTQYVRDPKAQNPKTQMAASPEYDDATMRALIVYFKTFAPTEAH
jgi:mono/diheme cytochrome c family protein